MYNKHIEQLIAHVMQNENSGWESPHLLAEHVEGVARLAESYAKKFNNGDWGRVAGLLHDLGKSSVEFQQYIRFQSGYDANAHFETRAGKVTHSTHGAYLACQQWPGAGRILAYLIAGHHAGLPDWYHEHGVGGNLADRLKEDEVCKLPRLNDAFTKFLKDQLADPNSIPCGGAPLPNEAIHLWMRMLFSCLVDADFLDTEQYMSHEQNAVRGKYSSLDELSLCLDQFMAGFDPNGSVVNQIRDSILQECRTQAELHPGLFTLTVPTGGGKLWRPWSLRSSMR